MTDMNKAITNLANSMTADYAVWQQSTRLLWDSEHRDEMLARYEETLDFKKGKKYIKVITDRSVSGFIVNVHDDPDFEYGTMLKAASYNSPARNFGRGNIFNNDDVLKVRWTGIQ